MVEAVVEHPQVIHLGLHTCGKAAVHINPVVGDSLFGVGGKLLYEFGHQLELVTEMVVNIGPGGLHRFGDMCKAETVVTAQHVEICGYQQDLLAHRQLASCGFCGCGNRGG